MHTEWEKFFNTETSFVLSKTELQKKKIQCKGQIASRSSSARERWSNGLTMSAMKSVAASYRLKGSKVHLHPLNASQPSASKNPLDGSGFTPW